MTPSLNHVGLYVSDLDRMRRFYTRVFELRVTDSGRGHTFPHDLVFLSNDPTEHHQLVLVSGRPDEATFSTIMQLSFKVGSLGEIRAVLARALHEGATEPLGLNHGNAWSLYCKDPEGNTLEVYTDTPWHVPQPCGTPLDLDKDDAEIYAETEAACVASPGYRPRAAWAEAFSAERAPEA